MDERDELYNSFQKRFPLEKLKDLTLEEYTAIQKTGSTRDDFTYWVETKADNLGGISVYSFDYGIYKSKDNLKDSKRKRHDDEYVWNAKYGASREEAWNNIRDAIVSIATFSSQENFSEIDNIDLSSQYKWKIAFLYSNKKITNIFRKNSLLFLAKNAGETVNDDMPFSTLTVLVREKCFNQSTDYWSQADLIWKKCKDEDNRIKSSKKELLKEIHTELLSNPELSDFKYVDNNVDCFNGDGDFFWIGIKNSEIGSEKCHYEIIIWPNDNTVRAQIHFEESSNKQTFAKAIENIPEIKKPKYCRNSWYEIDESAVRIDVENIDNINSKILTNLISLDSKIRETILKTMEGNKIMEKTSAFVDLLLNAKNLVLTGAPGTGKTYLAKNIAAQVMFKKTYNELNDAQRNSIGFVQFHPSYDYTDFVEGLRPIKTDDEKIGFERRNGIFKEFCKKAIQQILTDNFDEAWDSLINEFDENETITIDTARGRKITIQLNDTGTGLLDKRETWKGYYNYEQLYRVYQGKPGVKAGGRDGYRKAIIEYMKSKHGLKEFKEEKSSSDAKYVFIIDEINRGEVSKIFGELFYAIDPGYRGVSGKVPTQYQNLNEGDLYFNGFYVPENVYLIGTMNDIDRSVESMDFAFRRRFAWREIKASDTQEEILTSIKNQELRQRAKDVMNAINSKIWSSKEERIEGLSSAYHIGASYFLKLNDYVEKPFERLWEYNIKPLLFEYMRGFDDDIVEDSLEVIKKVYCEAANINISDLT